jgi:allantoinase
VIGGGEASCTVAVRGGRIAAIVDLGADMPADRVVTLAADEVLLPGLVDTHVHVNDPGRTEWEGFASATRAAAAGGVTTIVDMPLNSLPPTVDVAALEVKRKAAEENCFVDVGFWGGAIPGNVGDLRPLHDAGCSGSSVSWPIPVSRNSRIWRPRSRRGARRCRIRRPDDRACRGRARPGARTERGRPWVRRVPGLPAARCGNLAIAEVIEAARWTGGRLHILHLSSADALPMIRSARRDGLRLTAEVCPHYLIFAAEEIPDGATEFKCYPPIRESANRDELCAAVGDGTIDFIVSDHSPCTPELKRLDIGDFAAAWGGISSLQLGLPAIWTEARRRGHSLTDVIRWMAERPAAQVGLDRKGSIAVGKDADFAVFAPDETLVVDPNVLHHKNAVTPYAGRTLTGRVRSTWLRGTDISADVETNGDRRGRLLRRGEV